MAANEMEKKNKQAVSTALHHLPDDVIMQILSRVPAKLLLQFRYVCKYWLSIISNPSFVKLHLDHHSTYDIVENTLILTYYYSRPNNRLVVHSYNYMDQDDEPPVPELKLPPPLLNKREDFMVLGSCNGLLCIGFSILSPSSNKICIWNPCTNETRTLPGLPFRCRVGNISHGFGYSRNTDDYKVVRNTRIYHKEEDRYETIVDVYSLEANSWRTIIFKNMPSYRFLLRGIYANGAINYSMMTGGGNILRFDLDKEEYSVVLRPNEILRKYLKLGEYKGCLTILDRLIIEKSINLWVMEDYGGVKEEGWVRLFTIVIPELVVGSSSRLSYYSKHINDEILAATDEGYMVLYNPKYDSIRYLPSDIKGRGLRVYTESLVPLNSRVTRSQMQKLITY